MLSKFADYMKSGGAVDTSNGCADIQRDLDVLEKTPTGTSRSSTNVKCKVLPLGKNKKG